jgi:hypothetical protein
MSVTKARQIATFAAVLAMLVAGLLHAPAASAAGSTVRTRALARLAKLRVADYLPLHGYRRTLFPTWLDPDGNGCNARQDALIRYGTHVQTGAHCRIVSGTWRDPYSGRVYRRSSTLDCDHIVPLANAWISGARSWPAARRKRYANDPVVLLITSSHLNRQKGDSPPQEWKPPRRAFWITYAARWIRIKASYHLTITRSERSALRTMLRA